MIIINNEKSCKYYVFLLIFLISSFLIQTSLCCKNKNDYIIKEIIYDKNKENLKVDLQYDKNKNFNIKDYDIDNIRPNSKISLIKDLTFHARALTPKIFQFLITDKNATRFMPPLIDPEFKINLLKEKKKNGGKSEANLDSLGFELEAGIDQPFSFNIKDRKSKEYIYRFDGANFLFTDTLIMFDQLLTSKYIYGFGERNFDFNLEIGKYTTWPNDTTVTYKDQGTGGYNLMGHQPIGLHRTKKGKYLGFIFMNINAQDLVINTVNDKFKNNKDKIKNNFSYYLRHITIGGIINYFITLGNTPEEAISEIHRIIGRPIIPPFWGFGWHQCRWGYKTTKDLENILKNYMQYDMPLDGIWTDLDFLQNNKNFEMSILHVLTPLFINRLQSKGKKFVPLLDYALPIDDTYKYYNLGKNKCFIKSNYTKKDLISFVWPGKSVFPDIFVKEGQNIWLEGLYDFYSLANFDGLWIDMNEPANILSNGLDIGEIVNESLIDSSYYNIYHNIPYIPGYRKGHSSLNTKSVSVNAYSRQNNKNNLFTMYNIKCLISKIQVELTGKFLKYYKKRPFILSRGNTIGHGKYGFHWLGDNVSNFKFLRDSISGIFNYNIFGIPFIGADICGFHNDSTDELCARWHVLGAFYPFSRNHNIESAKSQEPWAFDSPSRRLEINKYDKKWPKEGYTLLAAKKAIKLKYTLLRYTYTQIFLISLGMKGAYFKPLFFEFPDDDILINEMNVLNTHIMVGDSFIFIPNLNEHESNYLGYFPNSNFNKFPEGTKFVDFHKNRKQGQFKDLKGGYLDINIFLRGGKIVPFQNHTNITSTKDLRYIKTSLIINPDENYKAKGHVIYDSDEIYPIENKTYLHIGVEFDKNNIKFYIMNIGKKANDHTDDIIEDIIIYRASQINKNIYKTAQVFPYGAKPFNVKIDYDKKKDIIYIRTLNIPIYFVYHVILS